MPRCVNELGNKHGKLLVLRRAYSGKACAKWVCKCDCGKIVSVDGYKLRSGNTRSCGCLKIGHWTHGLRRSPEYSVWRGMRSRCSNPKTVYYRFYGGRGIKVCKRWVRFENFFADMGPRPEGMTIERINNDGDYEPGNCRWATKREQSRNTSSNVWIKAFGKSMILRDWADEVGMGQATLRYRLKVMPVRKALSGNPRKIYA